MQQCFCRRTLELVGLCLEILRARGLVSFVPTVRCFPQVGLELSGHILAILPAVIIGIVAGCLAVVFTLLNLKIARLRDALTPSVRWKRMIEPCVVAVLFTTGSLLLPLAFPCTPTDCVTYEVGALQTLRN